MEGQNPNRWTTVADLPVTPEEALNPFSALDRKHYLNRVIRVVQVLRDVHDLDAVYLLVSLKPIMFYELLKPFMVSLDRRAGSLVY